jgi:hypothetical protein
MLLLVATFASSAWAGLYGTYMDPTGTVIYEDVADVNGLFGAPNVSANSLDFTPVNYEAVCSQCPLGATTTDTLTLEIQANPGQQISEITVNEGLDYSLLSFDAAGFASFLVTANIYIDILEVNQVPVSNINANIAVNFSASNNISVFGQGIDSGIITGLGSIDLQSVITNAGGSGEATRVAISFDNTLQVFHDGTGGQASLRKRDTDFVSLTINGGNPVPEPGTALLMMGGLAGLAARRRQA